MSKSPRKSSQLIDECQGLVRSLAWKIRAGLPRQVDLDDLIGYGQVGLAEAANAYDPARGIKFSTYAYYRIRGAIYDGLTMMSWFRQSPTASVKYDQAANDFLQIEHDERKDAGETSIDEDASWFRRITGSLAIAYLASGQDESSEDGAVQPVDHSTPLPHVAVCDEEVRTKVRELIDVLPGQEGILIRAAYYEGLSLKQAAKRLGVSKSWASRLHARTLKRLSNLLRQMGLAD